MFLYSGDLACNCDILIHGETVQLEIVIKITLMLRWITRISMNERLSSSKPANDIIILVDPVWAPALDLNRAGWPGPRHPARLGRTTARGWRWERQHRRATDFATLLQVLFEGPDQSLRRFNCRPLFSFSSFSRAFYRCKIRPDRPREYTPVLFHLCALRFRVSPYAECAIWSVCLRKRAGGPLHPLCACEKGISGRFQIVHASEIESILSRQHFCDQRWAPEFLVSEEVVVVRFAWF